MKVFVATIWDHDEETTEITGVYLARDQAVADLIEEYEMLWSENKPTNLEELNELLGGPRASVEEIELRGETAVAIKGLRDHVNSMPDTNKVVYHLDQASAALDELTYEPK